MRKRSLAAALMMGAAVAAAPLAAGASSHREAPFILETPRVDGTDFYMFRSYEPGRENFVTFISNWIPLQPPYGGPNFFSFDSDAVYEIKIDNDGDACEDLSFQFRFSETLGNNGQGVTIPVGPAGNQVQVEVPLINIGRVSTAAADQPNINFFQSYTVNTFRRDNCRGRGTTAPVTNAAGNSSVFRRLDYVGTTSFGSPVSTTAQVSAMAYETYARQFINTINIPGCATPGKVFVGQRKEPFYVDLGDVFDLLSFSTLTGIEPNLTSTAFPPIGEANAGLGPNVTGDFNITTIALEAPIACLVGSPTDPVIGAWMTSSLPTTLRYQPAARIGAFSPQIARGRLTQTSRLGMPLVNELVIGLPFKNIFNNSQPRDDIQFAKFVTNPTVPELVEKVFGAAGVQAPNLFPRTDLITAFLRGLPGLNAPANAFTGTTPNPDFVLAEMLRLNTGIAENDRGNQSRLGALGLVPMTRNNMDAPDDLAGFPNGRRIGDDVADVTVRAAMGVLLLDPMGAPTMDAPSGDLPFVDGALANASFVDMGIGDGAPNIQLSPGCQAIMGPVGMGTGIVDYDCSVAYGARFPYANPPLGGDLQP